MRWIRRIIVLLVVYLRRLLPGDPAPRRSRRGPQRFRSPRQRVLLDHYLLHSPLLVSRCWPGSAVSSTRMWTNIMLDCRGERIIDEVRRTRWLSSFRHSGLPLRSFIFFVALLVDPRVSWLLMLAGPRFAVQALWRIVERAHGPIRHHQHACVPGPRRVLPEPGDDAA